MAVQKHVHCKPLSPPLGGKIEVCVIAVSDALLRSSVLGAFTLTTAAEQFLYLCGVFVLRALAFETDV